MFRNITAFVCIISIMLQPLAAQVPVNGNLFGKLAASLEERLAATPAEQIDHLALARTLDNEPDAIVDWVRDNTRLVPYAGSLKGAKGVFFEREGSSLDRAILLAEMLRAGGQDVRVGQYLLSPNHRRLLLTEIPKRSRPSHRIDIPEADIEILPDDLGLTDGEWQELTANVEQAAEVMPELMDSMYTGLKQRLEPMLLDLRKLSIEQARAQNEAELLEALRNYWAVEVETDGVWEPIFLDKVPSVVGGPVNTDLQLDHQDSYELNRIPQRFFHMVEFEVIARTMEISGVVETTLVKQMIRASRADGQTINIAMLPIGDFERDGVPDIVDRIGSATTKAQAGQALEDLLSLTPSDYDGVTHWMPIISTGERQREELAISLDGVSRDRQRIDRWEGRGESVGKTSLLSIEVDLITYLGGQEQGRDRRTLAKYKDDGSFERVAVNSAYHIQTHRYSQDELEYRSLRKQLELTSNIKRSIATSNGELRTHALPCGVCDFFSTQRWNLGAPDKARFIESPNVFGLKEYHIWTEDREITAAHAFDIIKNNIGILGQSGVDPFRSRVNQGLRDAIAETFVFSPDIAEVSSAVKASLQNASGPRSTLYPEQIPSAFSPEAKDKIAGQLSAGDIILVEQGAWWNVVAETGDTISYGETGDGNAFITAFSPFFWPSLVNAFIACTAPGSTISASPSSCATKLAVTFALTLFGKIFAIGGLVTFEAALLAIATVYPTFLLLERLFNGDLANWLSGGVLREGDHVVSERPYVCAAVFGDCDSKLSTAALSWGDPHLSTIDGLDYDFQAVGEFVALRSSYEDFQVQTRQEPWRNSNNLSQNTAVAVNLNGMQVGVYAQRDDVLVINGEAVPNGPFKRKFESGGTVERRGNEVNILWADGSKLDVTLYPSSHLDIKLAVSEQRKSEVEGLLGNYDGNAGNDLVSRDGLVVRLQGTQHNAELYSVFGDSWRILNEESLFFYGPNEATDTFTDPGFPMRYLTLQDFSRERLSLARTACSAKGIPNGPLLSGCLFDVAATGDEKFADGAAAMAGVDQTAEENEIQPSLATPPPAACISTEAIISGGNRTQRGGGFCGYSCSQVMSLYDGVLHSINLHYIFKYPGKPDTSLKEWYEAELIPNCCTGGKPICN